jgi:hypothetical protein
MRALLRLFREAFAEEPTDTLNGPAVRFAATFFDDTDGEWWWADAKQWAESKPDGPTLVSLARSSPVPTIPPEKAAYAVRSALLAEERGECGGSYEHGGTWCPGYFQRGKTCEKSPGPPKLFLLADSDASQ